ncbi:MAG: FKBP-type peptidyl-prolyl cis-trans isomerase [Acidobacteria bacterium]|nr:FKBP-type peptidyl-prolyl cis-trans isomerase [Acidobacteriota bacterium]
MKKVSYAIGSQMGESLTSQGVELDIDSFIQGIRDGIAGTSTMKAEEISQIMMAFQTEMREKQNQMRIEKAAKNKAEGTAFLEKNKTAEGVKVTESGLQYKINSEGTGKKPKETDRVKVHYTGKLIDGTVFDSSVERGTPAEFAVNGVIKGWVEGLQLMNEGAKYTFYIPSDLAYGERGAGAKIGPDAMLIFDVELIEIK